MRYTRDMGKIDTALRNLPPTTRRLVIALAGGAVLIAGIPLIPLPGPGWLVVFLGFAILAQEFPWANRALTYGRGQYDKWTIWLKKQKWPMQLLVLLATAIIVILLLWLINTYGWINAWLGLGLDWAKSPLMR